ncbi:MAG: YwaF family protein [Erysipelotrichaceae bacterium]|nr:YwaF family protein [Erysipelotrichaceae bacterium]
MDFLLRWLRGEMGVLGDYTYQSMHIITLIVVVIYLIVLAFIAKSNWEDKKKRALLKGIAIFHLVFEILWRLIFYFVCDYPLNELWPMYPCNLGGVIVPIICLLDFTYGKEMFYLFAFTGGIITFAIPDGIFNNSAFVFHILKSILQHTGILAIPLFEYCAGYFKSSIKTIFPTLLGLLIYVFNSGYFAYQLGLEGDFMFLEMKLPCEISGVPQIITTTIAAGICLVILSIIVNPKEFINLVKQRNSNTPNN